MKELVAGVIFIILIVSLTLYVAPKNNDVNCQKVFELGTSGWHPDIPRATIDYCIKQRDNKGK